MRRLLLLPLLLAACGGPADRGTDSSSARDDSAAGTVAAAAPADSGYPAIRALYVNRWATQSTKRMRHMIGLADSTEINGLVLDIKDEFGLNYAPTDPALKKNAGTAGTIPRLEQWLDTLEAHGIHSIARIVVFKDSVAARVNPQHTMRRPDGTPWRDKEGLAWVNPYDRTIWEYNIRVAEDMVRLGFDEIQFDYIRFPEPYPSLPKQVFPGANGVSKPDVLAEFLRTACGRIRKLGGLCTADIFGLVTTVNGPLEVGQQWEKLSPVTDVLLPMVYPSHYPRGAFGLPRPNAAPYETIYAAIARAHERDDKLGLVRAEHVRPWLQAFSIGAPKYGAAEVAAQKRAVYDAGYDGWVLWSPGSFYDVFVPALERTFVSRKKPWTGKAKPVVAPTTGAPPVVSPRKADSTVRKLEDAAPTPPAAAPKPPAVSKPRADTTVRPSPRPDSAARPAAPPRDSVRPATPDSARPKPPAPDSARPVPAASDTARPTPPGAGAAPSPAADTARPAPPPAAPAADTGAASPPASPQAP